MSRSGGRVAVTSFDLAQPPSGRLAICILSFLTASLSFAVFSSEQLIYRALSLSLSLCSCLYSYLINSLCRKDNSTSCNNKMHLSSGSLMFWIVACIIGGQFGSTASEPVQSDTCPHLVPGLAQLSKGVDITVLDLTPYYGAINADNGFRQALFDYQCSEPNAWQSPYWKSRRNPDRDYYYSKPDVVAELTPFETSKTAPKVILLQDILQYRRHHATEVLNLSPDDGLFGYFSHSDSFHRAKMAFLKHNVLLLVSVTNKQKVRFTYS